MLTTTQVASAAGTQLCLPRLPFRTCAPLAVPGEGSPESGSSLRAEPLCPVLSREHQIPPSVPRPVTTLPRTPAGLAPAIHPQPIPCLPWPAPAQPAT